MRSDLHRLFDEGYITIDPLDRKILVSGRIREEFENGKNTIVCTVYRYASLLLQLTGPSGITSNTTPTTRSNENHQPSQPVRIMKVLVDTGVLGGFKTPAGRSRNSS